MATTTEKLLVGGVVLIAGYFFYRGFRGAAKDISRAAVNVVSGTIEGTVIGAGSAFNIPETNKTQCDKDIAIKNYWDSSFSCPAKRYAQFLITGK